MNVIFKITFTHDGNVYEMRVGKVGNGLHIHSGTVLRIIKVEGLYLIYTEFRPE